MKKIGITSDWCTKNHTLEDGVKFIKECGYDCIDLEDFGDTTTPFFMQSEREFLSSVRDIRKIYENSGLIIQQTHAPWTYPPPDTSEQLRKIRTEEMKKAVRGTAEVGSENFVVHPLMPFGPESGDNPEEFKQINYEFLRAICKTGSECGVTICLENMPMKLLPIATVDEVIECVKVVNEPNLKICLDTGHALVRGEQPAESVLKIGKNLLKCLHIHDNDASHDAHEPFYNGICDWDAFVKSLKQINYENPFMLEVAHTKSERFLGENHASILAQTAKKLWN